MAYFSQDDKKKIAPIVKKVLAKHGLKGSLSVRHNSTVVLTVKSGKIDFGLQLGEVDVNQYWYKEHYEGNDAAINFFNEMFPVLNTGNYDNSDIQTDYFDRGFYCDLKIGRWGQSYIKE